jgi:hypothetical protein
MVYGAPNPHQKEKEDGKPTVWQAKSLTDLAIGHYTKETSTKMLFATWYQESLLPALNNVGVAQENLAIMYLKKYVDNDLWESLHRVLVAKRKDEELEAWIEILGEAYNVFEDPTKYLSELHNTGECNQAPQEAPRSYHVRLQAVWAKAYPERKGDPAENPEYCTRFVAGLYPQYSKYLINERKDQLPMKGILTAVDEKMEMEQKWRAYKQSRRKAPKADRKSMNAIGASATPTPAQTAPPATTNLPPPTLAVPPNTSGHLTADRVCQAWKRYGNCKFGDSCKFEYPMNAKGGRNESQKDRREDNDRDKDRYKEQRQRCPPRLGPPSYSYPMWADPNAPPGYGYPYGWGYPGMPVPAYGQPAPMHQGWGQTA